MHVHEFYEKTFEEIVSGDSAVFLADHKMLK